MAKKFGKFLLFVTAACAAAAGVYYYLQKKENDDWDDEDFDMFDEDEDDDIDMDLEDRNYVSLSSENKAVTEESVTEADSDIVSETNVSKENDDKKSTPAFTEDYFDDDDPDSESDADNAED